MVDSLIYGLTTEQEKVKAIYYWVQDNIKYIAMEAGLGGFIPEEAAEVCKNKYGDCKGMSSITDQMLTIAGIESHLPWIGSRDLIYKYNEIPTPVVDNHMICTYINGDTFHFLDATGSEVPLSLSTSFIQGKEALIDMGDGKFQIHEVPIIDRLTNLEIDTTNFTIDETGKVIGKTKYISNGLNSIHLRRSLKGRTHNELKKYVSSYNAKGNNKFIVDTFQVDNIKDKDLPINISLEYTIQDYVTINGDELYVNMHLDRYFVNGKIDDDRENAYESDFKSTSRNVAYLDVPEGYAINYIPENDSSQDELFGYNIKYTKVNDKQIMLEFEVYENYLILSPEHFEDWNKMIKKLKNNYSETVILKKKI
ncbi:MAG: transglutaminase domain-containing protein [Flavobacteriales bacterium]|nr:transglutaminase domain-containing protein [Flavobacteriales bacterium]